MKCNGGGITIAVIPGDSEGPVGAVSGGSFAGAQDDSLFAFICVEISMYFLRVLCVSAVNFSSAVFPIRRLGDGFSHGGVGLDVFELVVVQDAKVSAAEGVGDGAGDFGLGEHDL